MPIPPFTMSRKAISEIKRRLKGSGIDNPYVLLGESTDDLTLSLSDGFLEAVTSGTAQKEMTASARAEYRSEEHTSELQSPCNLVCRLLLEKKKSSPVVSDARSR